MGHRLDVYERLYIDWSDWLKEPWAWYNLYVRRPSMFDLESPGFWRKGNK